MNLRKSVVATGAALVLSGLFTAGQDVEASSWEPRTVSEIKAEIQEQKDNQDDTSSVKYTFKNGDTLWGISEATGIPVQALTQVNEIANRDLIFVGNSIYLSKDNKVISVKDANNEVKSYDVSEDVKETETPNDVVEKSQAKAAPKEQAPAQQQSAPAQESQPAAQQTSSSSTGSLIGTFNATAYAVGDGLTPSTVTANGTNVANTIYSGGRRIIAVDTSVIPLGTTVEVHIPGWAPFTAVAADTGGAINGNKIDLLVGSPAEARNFGRQGGIKIYRVN